LGEDDIAGLRADPSDLFEIFPVYRSKPKILLSFTWGIPLTVTYPQRPSSAIKIA
jgi:hypothetical protein